LTGILTLIVARHAATAKGMTVRNYIAIGEPSDGGTWWISFPGLPGVTCAADRPKHPHPELAIAKTAAQQIEAQKRRRGYG
jgi:hypothetical protein